MGSQGEKFPEEESHSGTSMLHTVGRRPPASCPCSEETPVIQVLGEDAQLGLWALVMRNQQGHFLPLCSPQYPRHIFL